MNVHGRWEDRGGRRRAASRWARDFFKATAPFASGGVYVNFLTADEGDRVRSAYGANYDRLAQVKRQVRPGQPLPGEPEHQAGLTGLAIELSAGLAPPPASGRRRG